MTALELASVKSVEATVLLRLLSAVSFLSLSGPVVFLGLFVVLNVTDKGRRRGAVRGGNVHLLLQNIQVIKMG